MRKAILFLTVLFALTAKAQNDSPPAGLGTISSIGIGAVDKHLKPGITNSTQTSTGLEYRLSSHSSVAAVLTFDSYGYKTTGNTYSFDGRLKATGFLFSYRHRFGNGGWRPYLKAGGGAVRFSIPTVSVAQGNTRVENRVEVTSAVVGEAGVQFRVYRRFSLFVGAEREWVGKSDMLNTSLRVTTYKFGLVSSL